jgi:uncharacterized protein YndB with AHSA1/START domain
MSTDKIEKQVDIKAPMARVWNAITDSKEFGTWFGTVLEGPWVAGAMVKGELTLSGRNGNAGVKLTGQFWVDRLDREAGVFSFRWHPHAIDPAVDYSAEPLTTVTFLLTEIPIGTHLVITETGFDALSAERRATAFAGNAQGWAIQAQRIADYVTK